MRILEVNKYHYIRGGSETVFFNTSSLLRRHGHDVAEFCVHHPKNTPSEYSDFFVEAPEIRDLPLWGKIKGIPRFFYNRGAARNIEKLIKQFKPDVAHLHNVFNGISLSILPVLKRYGVPVVITLHDTRFICPSHSFNEPGRPCDRCLKTGGLNCGLHRCYEGSLLNSWMCAGEMLHKEKLFCYDRYIDRYIFVSKRHKGFHAERHDWFERKGSVIYNFLPGIAKIMPNKKRGDYMLFYGRISREKGIGTLLEVMKRLKDVRLKVVGEGPLLDEFRGLELPNVEFCGYMSGKELFDTVANASFVIVPSEWEENNPLTVIEAFTYGKPVIGARIGGIPELVDDSRGFLFESGDAGSLANVVNAAIAIDDSEYERMSENARAFAEREFEEDGHYERLISIFESVVNKN